MPESLLTTGPNTCVLMIVAAMQHANLGSYIHMEWLAPSICIYVYIYTYMYISRYKVLWTKHLNTPFILSRKTFGCKRKISGTPDNCPIDYQMKTDCQYNLSPAIELYSSEETDIWQISIIWKACITIYCWLVFLFLFCYIVNIKTKSWKLYLSRHNHIFLTPEGHLRCNVLIYSFYRLWWFNDLPVTSLDICFSKSLRHEFKVAR